MTIVVILYHLHTLEFAVYVGFANRMCSRMQCIALSVMSNFEFLCRVLTRTVEH